MLCGQLTGYRGGKFCLYTTWGLCSCRCDVIPLLPHRGWGGRGHLPDLVWRMGSPDAVTAVGTEFSWVVCRQLVRRQLSQFLFQAFHPPTPVRRRKSQFLFQAFHLLLPVRRRKSHFLFQALFLSQALCMSPAATVWDRRQSFSSKLSIFQL